MTATPSRLPEKQPLRVLLFEDEPQHLSLLQTIFSSQKENPVELTHAACLLDGVKHLAGARFDVILLDLNLPDSSGAETFATVRTVAKETPIIVLSASGADVLKIDLLKMGARECLPKGFVSAGDLMQAVLRCRSNPEGRPRG